MATEDEYWQWVGPGAGKPLELLDKRMPWPIARRQALILLQTLDYETFLNLREAIFEASEPVGYDDWVSSLDRFKSEWLEWREISVTKYRLQALMVGFRW